MQCSYFSFSVKVQGVDRTQWFFQTKLNLVWNFHEVDNGHQFFPNQSEFGLESASCKIPFFLSKPNWNWFGKSDAFFGCIFSKPNWIWFGKGHWIKCSAIALQLGEFSVYFETWKPVEEHCNEETGHSHSKIWNCSNKRFCSKCNLQLYLHCRIEVKARFMSHQSFAKTSIVLQSIALLPRVS